ncbi:MAG: hypothetical protein ACTJHL_13495 [Neisseriaceae bacterium]
MKNSKSWPIYTVSVLALVAANEIGCEEMLRCLASSDKKAGNIAWDEFYMAMNSQVDSNSIEMAAKVVAHANVVGFECALQTI